MSAIKGLFIISCFHIGCSCFKCLLVHCQTTHVCFLAMHRHTLLVTCTPRQDQLTCHCAQLGTEVNLPDAIPECLLTGPQHTLAAAAKATLDTSPTACAIVISAAITSFCPCFRVCLCFYCLIAFHRPLPEWKFKDFLGWEEQGDGKLAYGVFIQNGRLKGDLKKALRRVIERYELPVRLTPNHNLILCDIEKTWKADIIHTLSGAGVRCALQYHQRLICCALCAQHTCITGNVLLTCPHQLQQQQQHAGRCNNSVCSAKHCLACSLACTVELSCLRVKEAMHSAKSHCRTGPENLLSQDLVTCICKPV